MNVSVIIPIYNSESFLRACINSVLQSSYKNIEIILVDDGSVDNSLRICEEFKQISPAIRVLQHPGSENKGVSETRRLGISKAEGELIYLLDSDDLILENTIAEYVSIFHNNPDIVLIHGAVKLLTEVETTNKIENNFYLGSLDKKYFYSEEPYFLLGNPICNSTVCLRTEALGGVDFGYQQAFQVEDWVLWILLSDRGPFYYCSTPRINYRYHEKSATYEVVTKGHLFYLYSRLELYFVLLAKLKNKRTRQRVSWVLRDTLNDIYQSYNIENAQGLSPTLIWPMIKDCIKGLIFPRSKSNR